jgi:hypothetical protein
MSDDQKIIDAFNARTTTFDSGYEIFRAGWKCGRDDKVQAALAMIIPSHANRPPLGRQALGTV